MSEVLDLLRGFESINLEELAKVKLLDRMDRKYMFHSSQLPDVLSMAKEYYYILEVTENRYSRTVQLISILLIMKCIFYITMAS